MLELKDQQRINFNSRVPSRRQSNRPTSPPCVSWVNHPIWSWESWTAVCCSSKRSWIPSKWIRTGRVWSRRGVRRWRWWTTPDSSLRSSTFQRFVFRCCVFTRSSVARGADYSLFVLKLPKMRFMFLRSLWNMLCFPRESMTRWCLRFCAARNTLMRLFELLQLWCG